MTTNELWAKFENWWLRNGDPFNLHKVAAWETWQAAHASRDAEVGALRKDAERYRWLRFNRDIEWQGRDENGPYDFVSMDYLDRAIDAAMQEESK